MRNHRPTVAAPGVPPLCAPPFRAAAARALALGLALGAAAAAPGGAAAQGAAPGAARVTSDQLLRDAETPGDVLTWGIGYKGQRFSALDKINTSTVARLVPAWTMSFGGEKQRGQESQPLVHDGRLFVTASYSRLYAADARTGTKLWEYDYPLPDGVSPCCDVVNRGAALYDSLVYFGTLDAHLLALSQRTGRVVWKQKLAEYKDGYAYTSAPLVAKGMIITGVSGGEFGVVGKVEARDAMTGALVWTRPVIEGHVGTLRGQPNGVTGTTNATWPGDTWKTGGGATWAGGSYDPETNLVFFGTGNAGPWNAHGRKGDNLYTASTVAINADDGKIVWHYQGTPNDAWDYDGANELVAFEYTDKNGRLVKAGGKADRNGFFYVLDRTNGKLLSATPFVRKLTWASGVDLKTGRPIETGNRPGNPAAKVAVRAAAAGRDPAPARDTVLVAPSFLGGKNWMPMAYNPGTGLFYVPANEMQMDFWNESVEYRKGAAFLGAGFNVKPVFDDYVGALRAIDPKTGRIVWEYKNAAPIWSGVLTTGGGLTFVGTPEGYLKALDAKTGAELWKFQTGSGVIAPPVTYELDGEQYVAVSSGWGGGVPIWGGEVAKKFANVSQGGMLWVFKLTK